MTQWIIAEWVGESGYPHKTPPSPKHTHTVCTQLDSFSWKQSETAARQLLHCASSQPTVEDYTTYQKVFIHRRVCLITKAQRLHSLMSPGSNFRETERGPFLQVLFLWFWIAQHLASVLFSSEHAYIRKSSEPQGHIPNYHNDGTIKSNHTLLFSIY